MKRLPDLPRRVPVRTCEWTSEDGEVRLLAPRYGRSAIGRWVAARLGRPPIRVRLDALGSEVWRACDGNTRVEEIAAKLDARLGEDPVATRRRLAGFLSVLERRKWIRWEP